MGCGALTVAHENPFNREVLAEAGLFFSTPQQLAGLVDRIEGNDIRDEAKLRTWARESVKVRYSWELVTDRYEELFAALPPAEDPVEAALAEEQRR